MVMVRVLSQTSVGLLLLALVVATAGCSMPPMTDWPAIPVTPSPELEVGTASWYGPGFHGRQTSSGERYDSYELTAAHRKLPLGTRARVTNLDNGRRIHVRINDRGPYVDGRIIDLSYAAARRLSLITPGTGRVSIEPLSVPSPSEPLR